MKTKVFRTVVAILLLATGMDASEEKTTDARRDGLFGPVRSVSAKQELQQLDWRISQFGIDFLRFMST